MFFWLFIVAVFAALALGLFLKQRGLNTAWYEWVIGGIGLFLLFFTIDNYMGAFKEFENQAAGYLLMALGLPSLILLAVAGMLVWRRNRKTA